MSRPKQEGLAASSQNFFGTHASFQMHLDKGDEFLLAARRRKKSKVSSYIISQDLEDLKRDTDNCLAKLKANFVGTEYMLWGKSEEKDIRKVRARTGPGGRAGRLGLGLRLRVLGRGGVSCPGRGKGY